MIRAIGLEFLVSDKNSTTYLKYFILPENKIVNDFLLDIQLIKRKVHKMYKISGQLHPYIACSTYLIGIYKDFENFLYNRGFTDEAIKIYIVMNREKTEKIKYMMKLSYSGIKDKLQYFIKWIGRKIWDLTLGFGVLPKRIFFTVLSIVILWGLLFKLFNLVYYVGDQFYPASLFHCFYYSIVSITFVGSNFLEPIGLWGKVLQTTETILGFLIFAATVAFFTRKIK